MLDARMILRGERPFVDFAYHQPPLHLYLLAAAGKLFGPTLFGFRLLSVASVAATGVLLFMLTRPFVGIVAALLAQAVFLFTPAQMGAFGAVAETPMVLFTVVGVVLLFLGSSRASAYGSAVAFVLALLVKPTCMLMVVAAALSLAWGRAWRRLADFTLAGLIASAIGLGLVFTSTQGRFADVLAFHAAHLGARSAGMWTTIDSGFAETRALLGIATPWQWAWHCFGNFYDVPAAHLSIGVLVLSLAGLPLWVSSYAKSQPALRAFAVAWPASSWILDFAGVDFVSAKYFIPFLAWSSFLVAAVWCLAIRWLRPIARAIIAAAVVLVLATHFRTSLNEHRDPSFYDTADRIAAQYTTVVSFTPMLFAATTIAPGCGFENAALTYGTFGETLLAGSLARFRVSDAQLIGCLRRNPELPIVIDWAFYFFTRPGSALRAYLAGEGADHRLFFSPAAFEQWNRPVLTMRPGE